LNESQASIDVVADSGDFSDEFGENDSPSPSENCGNVDVEVGRNFQTIDKLTLNDVESMENHDVTIKRTKKQKSQPITPVQQMVDILKENSALKKRRLEEKSVRSDSDSSKTDFVKSLDDTDMFFLSMSKMTKQLPKIEQSRIKLGLSNSVLSAEIRANEQSYFGTPGYSCYPQQQSVSSISSESSTIQPTTSPSYYSSGEHSTTSAQHQRQSLLEMVSLPSQDYQ